VSVTATDIRFPTSLDKDGSDAIVRVHTHAEIVRNDYRPTHGHSLVTRKSNNFDKVKVKTLGLLRVYE